MKRKLAIFDIDGTIFRSSFIVELVNGFVKEGLFPKAAMEEIEKDYLAWRHRKGTYEKYIRQVVDVYIKYSSGKSIADVDRIAKKVLEWEKDRVYAFTRNLIKRVKEEEYFLLAISGSPAYIISGFAAYFGFDHWFGSSIETKDGHFTGAAFNDDSWKKKDIILKNFIKDSGMDADLSGSLAVGDTKDDIPMLEAVGNPIAFNPDQGLAEHAKKKGWRIVVERKDVIYDVKDFEFSR